MSLLLTKYKTSIKDEYIDTIVNSIHYFNQINKTYILKNDLKQFTILEKVVYDIASYHLKNIHIKSGDSHYIEFGIHNKGDNIFKTDKSFVNGTAIIPIFSSMLHLTEKNKDTDVIVYTNIDNEKYMYKDFSDDISLYLLFPEKCSQIVFDAANYYYSSNITDNIVLSINIWDRLPEMVTYFDINFISLCVSNSKSSISCTEDSDLHQFSFNMQIYKITDEVVSINNDNINIPTIFTSIEYEFLEKILYNKIKNNCENDIYEKLIKLNSTKSSIVLFKRKINNVVVNNEEVEQKMNRININEEKFIQRPIIMNKFQNELCNWIISESERYSENIGKWKINCDNTKTIQIENIQPIFSFILDSFDGIVNNICDYYSLNKNEHIFHIENIYISKIDTSYDQLCTDKLFYDKYENDIIVNILLNDEFKDGGKLFNDNITNHLHKGDMIIFNGNTKSKDLNVSSGIKYILVGYINISKIKTDSDSCNLSSK